MDWHYTENGGQLGPVTEEQLLQLAHAGVVRADTLVWRSGMAEWKPYSAAGPGAPPPVPEANGASMRYCVSCGGHFPLNDLAIFGESAVCANCKPAWIQKVRQGMTTAPPSAFHYAGFWIRVVATFIDSIILLVAQSILLYLVTGNTMVGLMLAIFRAAADPSLPRPSTGGAGLQLLDLAVGIAYFVIFWTRTGATPGKMVLGLKVVNPQGGLISVGQAFGRYFSYFLSYLILCIGFMMAGWDPEKRTLHDRLAGTLVIRTRA